MVRPVESYLWKCFGHSCLRSEREIHTLKKVTESGYIDLYRGKSAQQKILHAFPYSPLLNFRSVCISLKRRHSVFDIYRLLRFLGMFEFNLKYLV